MLLFLQCIRLKRSLRVLVLPVVLSSFLCFNFPSGEFQLNFTLSLKKRMETLISYLSEALFGSESH